ncbi:putative ABC transporter ATP-binding protein [Polystyrenella longa]|uniref:Putative ABC transporter ATP-binding protein n=1 Tax=Polystyrenella longa TaxID=2528007 RepID=A0A518CKZ2_9PLAN|nr:ATP-binding cassette domain-containing protein [Polystyrenella longa]QDU79854.1 putative ABC transporter ATP-binding protein [Polystyrenella longa]
MSVSSTIDPPIIALDRIFRSFGAQNVLRDLSIEVERGETLVLIGESGCGKSVTMKLMMALMEPSAGDVFWGGTNINDLSESELQRQRLKYGYLFQGAALFDSMNVFENIAFGVRQNTQIKEPDIRTIVHQCLRDVGLPESICQKKPAELSGGMKKRVGLARALALGPEVMFYDEPTTGLDPVMTDVINQLIIRTRDKNRVTSVVVTHEMSTVRKVADRVVMLYPLVRLGVDEPQVIFTGTPEELYDCEDPRVYQFVRGEAEERIQELTSV